MKGRESGMPPKAVWEGFFDPAEVLEIMRLNHDVSDVAEFGCGYGTFTIPAARVVQGTVYAIDIDPKMVAATRREADQKGMLNIRIALNDFMGIPVALGIPVPKYLRVKSYFSHLNENEIEREVV